MFNASGSPSLYPSAALNMARVPARLLPHHHAQQGCATKTKRLPTTNEPAARICIVELINLGNRSPARHKNWARLPVTECSQQQPNQEAASRYQLVLAAAALAHGMGARQHLNYSYACQTLLAGSHNHCDRIAIIMLLQGRQCNPTAALATHGTQRQLHLQLRSTHSSTQSAPHTPALCIFLYSAFQHEECINKVPPCSITSSMRDNT